MLKKIMKIVVLFIFLILITGISLNAYITMKITPKDLICHKGKLLMQINPDRAIYTQAKGVVCEVLDGNLVINYE